MADNGTISYSDFIKPDGSIDDFINKLRELGQVFEGMVTKVKSDAKSLSDDIKSMSSATAEGRRRIAEASQIAVDYATANKDLKAAISQVGKQLNNLQDKVKNTSVATNEQVNSLRNMGNSYQALEKEAADMQKLWDGLNDKERKNKTNTEALVTLTQDFVSRLKGLSSELSNTAKEIDKLRQADEKLKFAQSEAGQKLTELTNEYRKHAYEQELLFKQELSLIKAQSELNFALSDSGKKLQELKIKIQEAIRDAKLLARENLSVAGSYDNVRVQYEQARIALRGMASDDPMFAQQQALVNDLRQQLAIFDAAEKEAARLAETYIQLGVSLERTEHAMTLLQESTYRNLTASSEQVAKVNNLSIALEDVKIQLRPLLEEWRMLTDEQRKDAAVGGILRAQIEGLEAQYNKVDRAISQNASFIKALADAKERLAFLQTKEGEELVKIQEEIKNLTQSYQHQRDVVDKLAEAQDKLADAQNRRKAAEARDLSTSESAQIKDLELRTKAESKLAELTIRINAAKKGSYDELRAIYERNKLTLNAMSAAERDNVNIGKKLEEQTRLIGERLNLLEGSLGYASNALFNYQKAWSGLGFSVQQVVRELPSLAINWNTFFLAISNNIPIVIDEIKKLEEQNKALANSGKETQSAFKVIMKSLFGWQTALVVLLAILSKYGEKVIAFCKEVYYGAGYVKSAAALAKEAAEELEKVNDGYGKHRAQLTLLKQEWDSSKQSLESLKSLTKKYKDELNDLGIELDSVAQAESFFNELTEKVVRAYQLRAKAAAYLALATKRYNEQLMLEEELQQEPSTLEEVIGFFRTPIETFIATKSIGASLFSSLISGGSKEANDALIKARKELKAGALGKEADDLTKVYADLLAEAQAILEPYLKKEKDRGREPRDLDDIINRNQIKAKREYEQSITKLLQDEYLNRRKSIEDSIEDENNKLLEMLRMNEKYVANVEGKYKELTEEQREMISQQNAWLKDAIANNLQRLALELEVLQKEQAAAAEEISRNALKGVQDLEKRLFKAESAGGLITTGLVVSDDTEDLEASIMKQRDLLAEAMIAKYKLILAENKKLLDAGEDYARSEEEILIEMNQKILEIYAKYDTLILNRRKEAIANQLELAKKGSDEEIDLLLEQNELARQMALSQNAARPAAQRQNTADINALYDKRSNVIKGKFILTGIEQAQAKAKAAFEEVKRGSTETTVFQLEQEKQLWEKKLQLNKKGLLEMSDDEVATAESTIKKINRLIKEETSWAGLIGSKGLVGGILTKLGVGQAGKDGKGAFDLDDYLSNMSTVLNNTIDNIQSIIALEVELAEAAVEAAQARVDAAQTAYEAEVEARNNGYANNVATAKKELQEERRKQREKEKILAEAQKRQEALDTVMQTSSLITASANLWKSLSGVPIIGYALAIAAIAGMWASFAAAKIKARQVAGATQEYGEGGLEFLEGGSHASGNDIDLQTKNSKGKNMRAEGGEAMAIINKRNTRRYRKILPDIVDSLNKGVFEEKYASSFNSARLIPINNNTPTDLTLLESEVSKMRKQNEKQVYSLPDGTVIIQTNNVKRIIHS